MISTLHLHPPRPIIVHITNGGWKLQLPIQRSLRKDPFPFVVPIFFGDHRTQHRPSMWNWEWPIYWEALASCYRDILAASPCWVSSSWQILGQTESCDSKMGVVFPSHADQYRALPSCSPILVSLGLVNSAGLTLMTPWDPALQQRCRGTRWMAAKLGIPWDFCSVASDQALALSLNLSQLGEHHYYERSVKPRTGSLKR